MGTWTEGAWSPDRGNSPEYWSDLATRFYQQIFRVILDQPDYAPSTERTAYPPIDHPDFTFCRRVLELPYPLMMVAHRALDYLEHRDPLRLFEETFTVLAVAEGPARQPGQMFAAHFAMLYPDRDDYRLADLGAALQAWCEMRHTPDVAATFAKNQLATLRNERAERARGSSSPAATPAASAQPVGIGFTPYNVALRRVIVDAMAQDEENLKLAYRNHRLDAGADIKRNDNDAKIDAALAGQRRAQARQAGRVPELEDHGLAQPVGDALR